MSANRNPTYATGDVVYLRESAALGCLESYVISGVYSRNGSWIYTIAVNPRIIPSQFSFGERRSMVDTHILQFEECEFVDYCAALDMAEQYLVSQLALIRSKKNNCT